MLDLASPPSHRQSERAAPELDAVPDLPPPPKTVRETGLERCLLVELLAKAIQAGGKSSLSALSARLRLSINVLREVLDFMVAEQLAEVAWRGQSDLDVQYQLTAPGRQHAARWFERNPYLGPAPVPLADYRAMAARQPRLATAIAPDELAAVLADDGLAPAARQLLGAALYSGRSLLLYGPPGSGKSTLARKLGQVLQGLIALPHAILAGNEIVELYDPLLHRAPDPLQARQAGERRAGDARWLLCRRPLVLQGASLEPGMLELQWDGAGGCYRAPPQLKAAHGILVIDDLGRQRCRPEALLDRLHGALEQGEEQLALQGGARLGFPFDVALVLASSIAPQALFDPGALRRIGYKIALGALGEASYRSLFRQQCRAAGLACDEAALRYLVEELHGASGEPLLASFPAELLGRIADFAGFAGSAPQLTVAALDQAWSSMFAAGAGGAERAAFDERIA